MHTQIYTYIYVYLLHIYIYIYGEYLFAKWFFLKYISLYIYIYIYISHVHVHSGGWPANVLHCCFIQRHFVVITLPMCDRE